MVSRDSSGPNSKRCAAEPVELQAARARHAIQHDAEVSYGRSMEVSCTKGEAVCAGLPGA